MEMDSLSLSKVLNLLIRKFITELENNLDLMNVDKSKVFQEILKRNVSISQGIRMLALKVLANKTAGEPISNETLNHKIKAFMESVLQQDMIECALHSTLTTIKNVTNSSLFDSLFLSSMSDMNSMTSSFENLFPRMSAEDFKLCIPTLDMKNVSENSQNLDYISLSSQFNKSKIQFEEGLWKLQSVLGTESPSSDLKSSEAYSKLSHEVNNYSRNTISPVFNEFGLLRHDLEIEDWLLSSNVTGSSNNSLDFRMPSTNTWEGRMKQFVPCHLYSSELTEKEATLNVNDEDPQIFQSLYNLSLAIAEDDIKHDILDLLVGIPSSTFLFSDNEKKFEFRPHAHLAKLSHESTLKFVEKFIRSGNMFIKLKMFSSELFLNQEGLVLSGFKNGIQQILTLYTEYIMSVKMQKLTLQFLKTDVLEAAQLLNILESVCRINEENGFFQLPKGLGLISYLNENLWSQRRRENAIMIGVILKHAYAPYFNFLNEWINEGICYDPYDEFQILEDFEYLDRKDEMYWKYAHTEIVSDAMRMIPSEIQNYTADIMQCGKNMRLLKICCPQLFSLDFMLHNTPPSLSMIFSYNAASIKAENCSSYIQNIEKAELNQSDVQTDINTEHSIKNDHFFVIRANADSENKSKWDRCFYDLMELESSTAKNSYFIKRCNSLESLSNKLSFKNDIVFNDVGILFSSCDGEQFLGLKEKQNCDTLISVKDKIFRSKLKSLNYSKDCCQKNYQENSSEHCKTTSSFTTQPLNNERLKVNNKTEILAHFSEECEHSKYSEDLLPGTFTNSLASLLLSNYGDTMQDVNSCLQLISLQNLMSYNLRAVLDTRLHIVKKLITDYFMNQLKLQDLLICLKNTYLLLDESFSQLLCEKLFPWVLNSQTIYQFANWTVLNELFCNSFTETCTTNFPFLSSGSVNVVDLPEKDLLERNEFLYFFQFEFQVNWPLNIIIHKGCITQYMQAFSFLLELEFLCWLLGRTWWSLMLRSTAEVQKSSQFREIMLNRFDMHQFMCVLRNCIRHDLQGPIWDFLSKSLSTEKLSIDSLEHIHIQYLERVLARCFLTQETKSLHSLVEVICRQVYKFCIWVLESTHTWEYNTATMQYELSTFSNLCAVSETYRNYQKTFYDFITRLTVTRRFGICVDDGFKPYLQMILGSKRMFS